MNVHFFMEKLQKLGIDTVAGVPDSTLKVLCDYLNCQKSFEHYVTSDEGAALSFAIGTYLATGKVTCVYMQNSGIGNIVNPLTSMANEKVYKIPIFFVIGWRGVPGEKDEPQHKFMGEITTHILELLSVKYFVVDKNTTIEEYDKIMRTARETIEHELPFALIIKPGTFDKENFVKYQNENLISREDSINQILSHTMLDDVLVSTTGKISRELYECSEKKRGFHDNIFMCVGGMGYASMVAYGIALKKADKKVFCIDGDGAMLMHMGNIAFIGNNPLANFIHICLNNSAHESVGGMPTAGEKTEYVEIARACGYKYTKLVKTMDNLIEELEKVRDTEGPIFIEVKVSISSRSDLGRPKESAVENKIIFKDNLLC